MPRSRAATRDRIVQGAYSLFYRNGFARVTMDEIAASAGVTKRTLYGHYDSKDSLLADALAHHSRLALQRIDVWAGKLASGDPSSLDSVFADLARWSAGRRWAGAGFTRIVMELADLPGHPARKIAQAHKAAVEARLAERLGSPQSAAEIMLLIEGTVTLLLVHGDRRYAETAAKAARRLLSACAAEN